MAAAVSVPADFSRFEYAHRRRGAQAKCLECVDFGAPATVKADTGWFAMLMKALS
jgi:hypothetical protein